MRETITDKDRIRLANGAIHGRACETINTLHPDEEGE